MTDADTDKGAEDKSRIRIIEEKFFGNKDPKFLKTRRNLRSAENKSLRGTAKLAQRYANWATTRSDKTVEIRLAELDRMIAEHNLNEKKAREEKLKAKQADQQTVVELPQREETDGGDTPPAAA